MKKLFSSAFIIFFAIPLYTMDRHLQDSPSPRHRRFSVNDGPSIEQTQKELQLFPATSQLAYIEKTLKNSLDNNKALSEADHTFIHRIARFTSQLSVDHNRTTCSVDPQSMIIRSAIKKLLLPISTTQAARRFNSYSITTKLSCIHNMIEAITTDPQLTDVSYALIDSIGQAARAQYIKRIKLDLIR